MNEAAFLAALRDLPLHPGARALRDDAAVLGDLVVTHDMLVEGVHYLPGDPAGAVAWKLLAVNLSDLAAKGATPEGVLLGYMLAGDDAWDAAFLAGLHGAIEHFHCPLLGGDTVQAPPGVPRTLALTALGRSPVAPSRTGAQAGDLLCVTGTIGDGGAGLRVARAGRGDPALLARYRCPMPRLEEGRALAPLVHAMMDISDGLLIDAARMAAASGLCVRIDLAALPLSEPYVETEGDNRAARLAAATAGDDYELLFALPPGIRLPLAVTCLGRFEARQSSERPGEVSLYDGAIPLPLPDRLGFEHG